MKILKCIKCGQDKKCSEDRYAKLIEKFNGSQNLSNYICRNCRKK